MLDGTEGEEFRSRAVSVKIEIEGDGEREDWTETARMKM